VPGVLARYFEFWLLRLQGVYPSLAACPRCGGDLSVGGAWLTEPELALVCAGCASTPGPDLSPAALGFLRGAASVAPGRLAELPLARATGREIEAVHRALIRAHLEREPRSSRVLRELGAT
jgi:recombinational DNA repair protein (RecF pathway)